MKHLLTLLCLACLATPLPVLASTATEVSAPAVAPAQPTETVATTAAEPPPPSVGTTPAATAPAAKPAKGGKKARSNKKVTSTGAAQPERLAQVGTPPVSSAPEQAKEPAVPPAAAGLPEAVAEQPAAPAEPAQETFLIEPLGNEVYAAIAKIGGRASSNAMFVVGTHYVVAVGAHMTEEVIKDLNAAIAAQTIKPVRYFVLAHHHPGYSHVDFDFPPDQDVIMAWQAWQQLNEETRKPEFPIIFFNEGMTLKTGGVTVVLSNLGRGHSAGDVVTYIPEAGVIFASDLFYVDSVGYMAGGFMREWVLALEALEQLGAERIIPGTGPVSGIEEVSKFKDFFRDFLTEVIRHIERGDTLEQTLQSFDLPKYRNLSGYQLLMKANLKRAYEELKLEFGR